MTPQDLFGVAVRSIGLVLVLSGLLTFFAAPIVGLGFALVGVAVIGSVNWVVEVCYAPKWSLPRLTLAPRAAAPPHSPE